MLEWNALSEPHISQTWMDFGMIFLWDFGDGKMSLYSIQSVFQGFTAMTFAETLVICSLKKEPRSLMPRPSKVYILCQMVVFLRQAKWIPWQGHSTAISAETGYSWQEMVFASFVSWQFACAPREHLRKRAIGCYRCMSVVFPPRETSPESDMRAWKSLTCQILFPLQILLPLQTCKGHVITSTNYILGLYVRKFCSS